MLTLLYRTFRWWSGCWRYSHEQRIKNKLLQARFESTRVFRVMLIHFRALEGWWKRRVRGRTHQATDDGVALEESMPGSETLEIHSFVDSGCKPPTPLSKAGIRYRIRSPEESSKSSSLPVLLLMSCMCSETGLVTAVFSSWAGMTQSDLMVKGSNADLSLLRIASAWRLRKVLMRNFFSLRWQVCTQAAEDRIVFVVGRSVLKGMGRRCLLEWRSISKESASRPIVTTML